MCDELLQNCVAFTDVANAYPQYCVYQMHCRSHELLQPCKVLQYVLL